jgi:hypothetical protein
MKAATLALFDLPALAVAAIGLTLVFRVPTGADEPAIYRRRIFGAMLFGAALFVGGFATAWWATSP